MKLTCRRGWFASSRRVRSDLLGGPASSTAKGRGQITVTRREGGQQWAALGIRYQGGRLKRRQKAAQAVYNEIVLAHSKL
jgi:hypothetical protein